MSRVLFVVMGVTMARPMYVVVLIAFITANALPEMVPMTKGGLRMVLPALAVYLAGSVAIGSLRSALSLRAAGSGSDHAMRIAAARHGMLSMLTNAWLVGGLGGLVIFGYGHWVMVTLGLRNVPLAGRALLVTPFIVAMILNWLLEYRFYRIAKTRMILQQRLMGVDACGPWTIGEYLSYNLRHQFLFVAVPIAVILLINDSIELTSFSPTVKLIASTASALTVIVIAPVMIVRVWRTAAMPVGELRDELVRVSQALKLRFRRLLVWRTGGMIANAMVMGILWPVRYVLLSDALIQQLDEREVRAVFAHEAGHIVGHHLFYAMLFSVSSIIVCSTAAEAATWALGLDYWFAEVFAFSLLAPVWLLGFGYVSRRFERQSDVVAAWYCGEAGPSPEGRISPEGACVFARSLERIAMLNGIGYGRFNWRHGSIRSRVEYVMWLGSTGGTRAGADRAVRRVKAMLWVATLLSATIMAVRIQWDI